VTLQNYIQQGEGGLLWY